MTHYQCSIDQPSSIFYVYLYFHSDMAHVHTCREEEAEERNSFMRALGADVWAPASLGVKKVLSPSLRTFVNEGKRPLPFAPGFA